MIGCKEETWEVTSHESWGIFNVIGCKEETWEVTSNEFWGYLI